MANNRSILVKDCSPQNIFSITNRSLAHQLERTAWIGAAAGNEQLRQWYEDLQRAFSDENFDALHMETLSVRLDAERSVALPVSFANNQFRAADSALYPYGHDSEVSAAIDLLLPDDGVLFDVGASWGTFSFAAALRPNFRGEVHAFEPSPQSAGDFRRIAQVLPLDGKVTLHQLALSDHTGPGNLWLHLINSGGNSIQIKGSHSVEVSLHSLDELTLPAPNVIKIDIEGHEAAMINGGVKTIAASRPAVIFENWLHTADTILETMEPFIALGALNYRFYCPAWLDAQGRLQRRPEAGATRHRFALMEFALQERLGLAEGINVVALPADMALDRWSVESVDVGAYPFQRQAPLFL